MKKTMDHALFYSFISLFFFFFLAFKLLLRRSRPKHLPPSPTSLPLIGHLLFLSYPLHRTFHKLSNKYGTVFSLKLGSRMAVVVSNPTVIQECFTKNDIVFSNRPPTLAGKHIAYNNSTMVTAPYGEHWRHIRRVGNSEIFSTNRLNTYSEIRGDEVKRLLQKLSRNSVHEFSKVELHSLFSSMTFNIVMRMAAGKTYSIEDSGEKEGTSQLADLMKHITSLVETASPGDFLPFLNWIDPTGYEKRLVKIAKRTDEFIQRVIDEVRARKEEGRTSMIDNLLFLQRTQPQEYSDQIIKGLVQALLLGGADTTSVTLEWAMANLLNNPRVLSKARQELDSHVGEERLVVEADIPRLPYLQHIISETFRLNPPVPLLVPHFSSDECIVGGYELPRGTILFVNAWAMHRDPELWEKPTCFRPERFENAKEEEVERNLIPFGVGRRGCPGDGMAERAVGLGLAALVQCFEWRKWT